MENVFINMQYVFGNGASLPGMIFFFIWGCFWGSFINVCVYRLPYGRSIVYPGSSCPSCGQPVKWWQNIPIVSYVLLKAKCWYCFSSISVRYPLVELLTGLLCAFLFYFYGGLTKEFAYAFIFTCMLIIIFFIDLDHWLILDCLTFSGMFIGAIGSSLINKTAESVSFFSAITAKFPWSGFILWNNLFDSMMGIALGYMVFSLIAFLGSLLLRQEAMGGGDIKFAALIGAFLGFKGAAVAFVLSFFIGFIYAVPLLIIKRKKGRDPVPFGTFMAIAAFIAMLYQNKILMFMISWQELLIP